jgi:hypothetical protein
MGTASLVCGLRLSDRGIAQVGNADFDNFSLAFN